VECAHHSKVDPGYPGGEEEREVWKEVVDPPEETRRGGRRDIEREMIGYPQVAPGEPPRDI
jgi:hypothetical protein